MNHDTLAPPAASAAVLRDALVDQLTTVRTPAVEAAMRAVPRHLFVPGASLADAYINAPVHIKHQADGTSISCASQPSVVAQMLEQLQARPADRVLELGAGSGYNAALLATLVGDDGHVTTVEMDGDLVTGARAHLAAAGIRNVEVVPGDGALGHASGAPYDRIVATVGAHGVPPAWLDQLAPGGRLLVPLRLAGSVCRSVAFERSERAERSEGSAASKGAKGRWRSVSSALNTFVPLRGETAGDPRRVVPLTADGSVRLPVGAGQPVDAEALSDVLAAPRTVAWTGVRYRAMESPEWMELWLACALPSGLNRMLFPLAAKGGLLADDPYPSSSAAFDGGALAYLARRLSERTTEDGGKLWEFGVVGHGPGADGLVDRVVEAMRAWDRDWRGREAAFELLPTGADAPEPGPGRFVLDTPLNRLVVDWS
ncbi:methyltransferase, FxLD system [Streptomyces triticirhizae]|uniref:Protein-L-isoaspartate O-methyltransferase n=1 Tax=Streptomyces triticirhizae TaxID=2483353 RepID=A0A3M2L7X9_9ACTN|nr:methyltransferase, FxLD system [Streptomyces triticirhizae]